MTALVCPVGHQSEIPTVAYGYPGPEMWQAERRGEITIGGCLAGRPIERPCPTCGRAARTVATERRLHPDAIAGIVLDDPA
jgi:hypothetical protein